MVRLKHRYLLVNILYPNPPEDSSTARSSERKDVPYTVQFHQPTSDRVDARSLTSAIRHSVGELFGDYGSGMTGASLQVKYFSPATSTAIIRVSRDHYRLVWAALTFTLQLPKPVNQPCVMQVMRVSGTIKKAEEAAIQYARMGIRKAQREASGKDTVAATGKTDNAVFETVNDGMELYDSFANGIQDPDAPDDEDEIE